MELSNLFQADRDWLNNACINTGRNQHHTYSLGYKEAADFLAKNASDIQAQDLFIYPIAFLYRHHIELQLKLINKIGNQLLNRMNDHASDHDLKTLWATGKSIILKVWNRGDPDYLKPIDHVISAYQKIDPKSTAFRYPADLKGNIHLQRIGQISISTLSKTVNDAALILDGIYDGLIDYIDGKSEMSIFSG